MALMNMRVESEGLGKRKRGSRVVDEEDELDMESYFANYVPLSNLPTPPSAAKSASESLAGTPTVSQPAPAIQNEADASPNNDLPSMLHPAVHLHRTRLTWKPDPSTFLASLVPQNSSIQRPSPHVIQSYLSFSALPESTIALAACILDSLSGFFIRTWSREINSLSTTSASSSTPSSPLKSYFAPKSAAQKPELVVLAALKIARDFLHDSGGCSARWWARDVAQDRFVAREVERSVWCVLRDLDYDLLSFEPEIVEGMRREIFCGSSKDHAERQDGESLVEREETKVAETELDVLAAESFCDHYDSGNGDAEKEYLPASYEGIPSPMAMPRPRLTLIDTNKDRITVVVEGLPTPDLSPPTLANDVGDLTLWERWLELNCC